MPAAAAADHAKATDQVQTMVPKAPMYRLQTGVVLQVVPVAPHHPQNGEDHPQETGMVRRIHLVRGLTEACPLIHHNQCVHHQTGSMQAGS